MILYTVLYQYCGILFDLVSHKTLQHPHAHQLGTNQMDYASLNTHTHLPLATRQIFLFRCFSIYFEKFEFHLLEYVVDGNIKVREHCSLAVPDDVHANSGL